MVATTKAGDVLYFVLSFMRKRLNVMELNETAALASIPIGVHPNTLSFVSLVDSMCNGSWNRSTIRSYVRFV